MWPALTHFKPAVDNNQFYIRWLYLLSNEYRGAYFNHKNSKFSGINKVLPKFQTTPARYLSLFHLTCLYHKLNCLSNSITALDWKSNLSNFLNTKPSIVKRNIPHNVICKLQLNKIVALGFYSGSVLQRMHIFNIPLFYQHKAYSKAVVNQLLDYLYSLYISPHNMKSLKPLEYKNDYIHTPQSESFIEFAIPKIDMIYTNEQNLIISNEDLLIHLQSAIKSMNKLHLNIKKIFRSCGYLPIEHRQHISGNNQLRIYFPNMTLRVTKILVSDLKIKESTIYECSNTNRISFKVNRRQNFYQINNKINNSCDSYNNEDDILSSSCNGSFDSINSDIVLLNSLSPILSQESV